MNPERVYMKIEQHSEVEHKEVKLSDVAQLYCNDQEIVDELGEMILLHIESTIPAKYCFSIMRVVNLILEKYPGIEIVNLGETDFIISYIKHRKKHPVWEYMKVAVVCIMIFFGGAFSIMTFNTDVSLQEVFDHAYELVMGHGKEGGSILEVSYSIGLPVGIIVFYNHFSHKKRNSDPTPIQIEMRKYEADTNAALLQEADREGKVIN